MFHEVFRGEGQDAGSLLWEVQKWTHIHLEREAANPSTMLALANLHEGPQVLHCYFNVALASKIKGWGNIFDLISPQPVCAPIPPPQHQKDWGSCSSDHQRHWEGGGGGGHHRVPLLRLPPRATVPGSGFPASPRGLHPSVKLNRRPPTPQLQEAGPRSGLGAQREERLSSVLPQPSTAPSKPLSSHLPASWLLDLLFLCPRTLVFTSFTWVTLCTLPTPTGRSRLCRALLPCHTPL